MEWFAVWIGSAPSDSTYSVTRVSDQMPQVRISRHSSEIPIRLCSSLCRDITS